jgi:hypothetical protein
MDTLRIDDLQPHPFNVKVYGKIDWALPVNKEFLQSIKDFGIRQPITYTRLSFDDGKSYGNYIVSGHRRWEAAKKIGLAKVPVHIWGNSTGLKDAASLLAAELYVVDANRQRVKTAEQKAREFKELKRIEAALAEARMKSGRKANPKENFPQGGECPSGKTRYASIEDLQEAEKPSKPIRVYHCRKCDGYHCDKRQEQARDKAAEVLGLSGKTAEKLEKLVDEKDAGNQKAAAALAEIDAKKGRGVDAAYRSVVQPKPPKNPEVVQAQKKCAEELQTWLKTSGLDADVVRSKSDEEFHVTLHGLSVSPSGMQPLDTSARPVPEHGICTWMEGAST